MTEDLRFHRFQTFFGESFWVQSLADFWCPAPGCSAKKPVSRMNPCREAVAPIQGDWFAGGCNSKMGNEKLGPP